MVHHRKPFLLVALIAVTLSGCASSRSASDAEKADHTLILISLDGFAASYLSTFEAPNITELARGGLQAGGLVPTFPSKTFPTHYSVVTGMHAGNHGIIANRMYDPEMDEWFWLSKSDAVSNGEWYDDAEPIWVTAEEQGVKTAPMFWPGSEAEINGRRPTYWFAYDGQISNQDRVAQALQWMDLPDSERPAFISLYFSDVDGAGHRFGPDSDQVGAAIARVDSSIGLLLDGLEERDRTRDTDIIILSDHGMTAVDTTRIIVLDDYIDVATVTITDTSPVLALLPDENDADSLVQVLASAHPNMQAFNKKDLPARFHYSEHVRIPPVIAIADEGWTIVTRERYNPARFGGGTHGYDNALKSMHGLFVASGPSIPGGTRTDVVDVIDIYNLLAELLGIVPAENDGTTKLVDLVRH